MSLESAMAVLDKANAGTGQPVQQNLTATMVHADVEKAAQGGKTLDKVMGEVMDATNNSGTATAITAEEELKKAGGKSLEQLATEQRPGETIETKISPKIEALMKRERRIQQEAMRTRQEREALAREKLELDGLKRMRDEMKRNPAKALEYGGVSYKQITDSILKGNGEATPELQVAAIRDDIKALREERENEKVEQQRSQRTAAQRELQQVQADYMEDIKEFGINNPDTYELTNLNGGHNLVYQVIDNHYRQTGKVMSIKQGYDILEQAMEAQIEKNLQSKKWKSRGAIKASDTPNRSASDTRTLTNNMTSSAPSFLPAKSEEERMKRAMEKLG